MKVYRSRVLINGKSFLVAYGRKYRFVKFEYVSRGNAPLTVFKQGKRYRVRNNSIGIDFVGADTLGEYMMSDFGYYGHRKVS